jgi:hypothetical protein
MEKIYLDREQCERFSLEYFGDDQASLRADEILSSKLQGYDREHTEFLQGFGSEIVSITRVELDAPGWYSVNSEAFLSDEQLEIVIGGMSTQRFNEWRAKRINESR